MTLQHPPLSELDGQVESSFMCTNMSAFKMNEWNKQFEDANLNRIEEWDGRVFTVQPEEDFHKINMTTTEQRPLNFTTADAFISKFTVVHWTHSLHGGLKNPCSSN